MPLPELDHEAREAALRRAGEARAVRAELKEMLKAGEVGLGDVLDRADASHAIARMRVRDLLEALPNIGRVRAARVMEECGIAPTRRVRGLGPRQQEALRERFGA